MEDLLLNILETVGRLEIDAVRMLALTIIGVVIVGFALYKLQAHRVLWWIIVTLSVIWLVVLCFVVLFELIGHNFSLPIL